jgi:hypothetical protein
MAIDLSALFTALGHLYYPMKRAHTFVGSQLAVDVPAAVTGLGVTNADVGGPLISGLNTYESAVTSQLGTAIRTAATAYLTRIVNNDVTLPDRSSVQLALRELVRQMVVQSYKVSACTVTAAAAAVSGNTGNGAVVITTKRGDGLTQQNLLAEVGQLLCTGDAQAGTATAGSEPFTYSGDPAPTDVLGFAWPGASGASTGLAAVDAAATSPNLLTNGAFETFTVANTPDGWTIGVGTPGTDIFSEASVVYAGTKALKFLGVGSTRPTLRQTLTTLKPNRVYAVNCWVRSSGTLTTAANLKLRLVDGSNAVITDDQAAENGVTADLTTLTTGYVAKGGVLITPKVLPATVKLQLEASNGANLVTSEAVYVDSLAMAEVNPFLYPGGPGLAVFAGSVPFMTGDSFDVTMTNNRNGASYGATWQTVFDRWFGMRGLGLLLPTSGTTLLNDSLIA